jgi:glycosyltransferase involved in cell wall biosynthesis
MKILWFSNTPALGQDFLNSNSKLSSSGGWLNSLNAQLENKVELHIAFMYPYRVKSFVHGKTTYYPIFSGGIYINWIRNKLGLFNTEQGFLDRFIEVVQLVNPDLVHIHGTESLFISMISEVKIPTLVSIQGNIVVINHKFFAGFHGRYLKTLFRRPFKDLIFETNSYAFIKKKFEYQAKLEKASMKHIKNVIGRTSWDERLTRVLAPNSKYFVGQELLRNTFYENKWMNLYAKGKLILFTTTGDSYYKGIETVFMSISILENIDFEWRIAGISDFSRVVGISKKYLGRDFPKMKYIFLGSLNETELVREMLNAHIYIMPSHIENSPNNLCEAMILGMPCIATFAGGTGSILRDGEDGILIQDGDPWALSGAILELYNNPALAQRYSVNARGKALNRHDKSAVSQQYVDIYREILNI